MTLPVSSPHLDPGCIKVRLLCKREEEVRQDLSNDSSFQSQTGATEDAGDRLLESGSLSCHFPEEGTGMTVVGRLQNILCRIPHRLASNGRWRWKTGGKEKSFLWFLLVSVALAESAPRSAIAATGAL